MWSNRLQPVFELTTLMFAFLIWFSNQRSRWEESLPKRLSVTYVFDGRPVMRCERATLIDESDIRAMAQQMGAQMAGGRLAFGPVVNIVAPSVERIEDGTAIRCYGMSFHLTELPDCIRELSSTQGQGVLVRRVVGHEFVDNYLPCPTNNGHGT
ncbi:MAG: hypothetical protein KDB23_05295 [Planctomycetales bacterium]|nr:hypothetical protein [Planctomycetales bacterium]